MGQCQARKPFFLLCFFSVFSLAIPLKAGQTREVKILDRPYRTLTVLPFSNRTPNKNYSFLSKDLAVFFRSELKALGSVLVRTQEIERPLDLDPNITYKFTYPQDWNRILVVSENDTNRESGVMEESDYVVRGDFKAASKLKDEETWIFRIVLSNTVSRKVRLAYEERVPYKRALDHHFAMTEKLKRELNGGNGILLKIRSGEDQSEVLINGVFKGFAEMDLFLSHATNRVVVQKNGYRTFSRTYRMSDSNGKSLELDVKLERDSNPRMFNFFTFPSGQKVYLNEQFVGISPVKDYETALSQGVVYVESSNYRSYYAHSDLSKSLFPVMLKKEGKTNRFFSNRNLAWASFWTGCAVLGAGVYYQMESGYHSRLSALRAPWDTRRWEDYERSENSAARASWFFLSSVPFYALTIHFTIRLSDEKDW